VTRPYASYALGVIFFANFLSYLDRQIVSALETALTARYGLNHKEFGLLWTAFTVGYMVFAPIVGFLTDRYPRPRIFAICVFLWSIATIASGYAPDKHVLYAMRFFIGIGEAGCLVIGPTMISDYFSRAARGRALSVFFLALPLGGTAGYLVGGFLAHNLKHAFFWAGFPGFLASLLIWLLVEPPRGGSELVPPEPADGAPPEESPPSGGAPSSAPDPRAHPPEGSLDPAGKLADYSRLLRNRTLMLIILAQAFAVTFLVPLLHFGVGFFVKERHIPLKQATLTLGIIALAAGGLGNSLSGILGDRLAKRMNGAYSILAGCAFTLGLPFLILGFSAHRRGVMLPALALGAFCYFLCMPAVNTQIANAVAPRQRAMAYALAVFILHLLGDTTAPYFFGAVVDALRSTEQAFRYFSFALALAGGACFLAARTAAQDEARAAHRRLPASGRA
jgi:MFS family permease